ncbi:RPM1-interacting protein, partial [Actinidia chinensis var. chinensis]
GEYQWKRSGQIPAFGNWEYANDLPITQYFASARQAGLKLHYFNSSCEWSEGGGLHFNKPPPPKTIRGGDKKWCPGVKEQKKHAVKKKKVGTYQYQYQRDVTEAPRKQNIPKHIINTNTTASVKIVKAHGGGGGQRRQQQPPKATAMKDEDLYKIPPHLLQSSNWVQEKAGFFFKMLNASLHGVTLLNFKRLRLYNMKMEMQVLWRMEQAMKYQL